MKKKNLALIIGLDYNAPPYSWGIPPHLIWPIETCHLSKFKAIFYWFPTLPNSPPTFEVYYFCSYFYVHFPFHNTNINSCHFIYLSIYLLLLYYYFHSYSIIIISILFFIFTFIYIFLFIIIIIIIIIILLLLLFYYFYQY